MRIERAKKSALQRLQSMVSYFTQSAFEDEPAEYLRETDCYKVPFDDVAILFLNQNMETEDVDDALILRALNGVVVGLGVMKNTGKMEEDEPPHKKRKLNGKEDGASLNV